MAGPTAAETSAGSELIATTAVQLLGVGIFAIIAGISDELGKVMVVIMAGILLGWLLLHTSQFAALVAKL